MPALPAGPIEIMVVVTCLAGVIGVLAYLLRMCYDDFGRPRSNRRRPRR